MLLRVQDVVRLYRGQLTVNTLAQWRYRRIGPKFIKKGHAVYYPAADLLAWETEQPRLPGALFELRSLLEGLDAFPLPDQERLS